MNKPRVKLIGEDGNAFAIIVACRRALRKAGKHAEAQTFFDEATSGDYDNLLRTAAKYCSIY